MSTSRPVTDGCPYCSSVMHVTEMSCGRCAVAVRARFPMSRLGRMPVETQRFIEMFVLCGGNLKELALQVGVSYPTIRSRLDKVIEAVRGEMQTPSTAPLPTEIEPDVKHGSESE